MADREENSGIPSGDEEEVIGFFLNVDTNTQPQFSTSVFRKVS